MTKLRITKILCPSCEGSGRFSSVLDFNCLWCKGEKRVSVETAHRYADQIYMIAGGGYVMGDHSYEHMVKTERRAEEIYDFTETPVPWVKR